MTTTATDRRLSATSGVDDTVHHYTSCHDENLSACGVDISEVPWTNDPIDCIMCVAQEDEEPEVCTCRCCGLPA